MKNRFVCSATWMGLSDPDGACSQPLVDRMVELARGEVGLIITEFAVVSRQGQSLPFELGAYSDEMLPGLTRMTEAVHDAGARIVLQLAHAGLYGNAELTGLEPIGPSVLSHPQAPVGREMSLQDIRDTERLFVEAALRARRAGFDGIQVHAGHGFLLSQFLSPFFNKRTDGYGGSIDNRARLAVETVRSIREAVGEVYPVLVKMNAQDYLEGGLVPDEMLQVAAMLETAGMDALEISGGSFLGFKVQNPDITFAPVTRGGVYYEEAARRYKAIGGRPLMLVGGIRSLADAQRLVEGGTADYVSLSRPLIREPDLVKRWKSGDTRDSSCTSDDECAWAGLRGQGVHCVHARGYRRQKGMLKFYSGSTGTVNTKRAVAECLEIALGEGSLDCDLLIFYTTMGHNFGDILSEARKLCPTAEIVGCTCAGVIGREGPNESMRALAVMAVRGAQEGVAVAAVESIVGMDPYDAGARIARELKAKNPAINVILYHPAGFESLPFDRAVKGIESVFGAEVPICGGLSIDNMKLVSSFQFAGGRIFERGAVAVGLADPTLEVISLANHGFSAVGEPFTVTRSISNRVYELDGKPPWRKLTERLGVSEYTHPVEVVAYSGLAEELPADMHDEYGSGYILRGNAALQDAEGSFLMSVDCPVGKKLWLGRRDDEKIMEGLDRMVESIVRRCGDRRPVAVFHSDCAIRGKPSFNRILKDEIVNRMQQPICRGENVPWLGMYGGGEFAMLGGRNAVHFYTTSLYVMVERDG